MVRKAILDVIPSLSFEDVDDVAQDVWMRVWEKRDQYKPSAAALSTWVHEIATSVAKNYVRDNMERQPELVPDSQLTCEDEDGFAESWLEQHVVDLESPDRLLSLSEGWRVGYDSLSTSERAVFALAYSDEAMTSQEIADELQISASTVRTYLQRIRAKINL